jgi:hypothetical protein
MLSPNQVFLFNSSLPEQQYTPSEWIRDLGPTTKGIIGANTGNGYISYALLKILCGGPAKVASVPNAWESVLPPDFTDRINRDFTHFVFVMQDFIRDDFHALPFERINRILEKIRIPIVPISLCANGFNGYDPTLVSRLSGEQKRFLALIAEKSPRVGVRGQYSAEIFHQLGIKNVQITGCPAYYESGPTRTLVKRPWNPQRVVTSGCFFHDKIPSGMHVLQDELVFVDQLYFQGNLIPKDIQEASLNFMQAHWEYSMRGLLHALCGHMAFFPNFDTWDRFYTSSDWCLTIGTRLHSAIFSCNRGVPAICTNSDARARETCEYFGIPHRPELDGKCDLTHEYEMLDLSHINKRYGECHAAFLDYLQAHGLQRATTPFTGERLQFPDVEQPQPSQMSDALYARFTELVEAQMARCSSLEQSRIASEQSRIASEQSRIALEQSCLELEQQIRWKTSRLQKYDTILDTKIGRLAKRLYRTYGKLRGLLPANVWRFSKH